MHFISECVREWCLSFFVYLFACGLGLLARFTNERRPIVNKLDAFKGMSFYHSSDGIRRYVGQASVQRHKIDALLRGCRCKHPLDFVQPILAGWNRTDDLVRLVSNLAGIVFKSD